MFTRTESRSPILIQSSIAFMIGGAGDGLMQFVDGNEEYDFARSFRLAAFRGLMFAPAYSLWLRHLGRRVTSERCGGKMKAVATKVFLDQTVWAVPSLATGFVLLSLMEGNALEKSVRRSREVIWPCIKMNWAVWPAVQLVTFSVVPAHLRIPFVSLVQVVWGAVISNLNETAKHAVSDE